MRTYVSPGGERRLWFDPDEIEHLVEDELRRAGLMPTPSSPVTDLEAFVESHLRCPLDQYGELPSEVLGLTEFRRGGPPSIVLNRDLTGSALDEDETPPGVLGRWRATLAHEACHVLLHQSLFAFDEDQGELFAHEPDRGEHLMRCLKRDVEYRSRSQDWREVQANRGMAAMLMPKKVFVRVVREELAEVGLARTDLQTGSRAVAALAGKLAGRFDVSRAAATIRLSTTGVVSPLPDLPLTSP